MQTLLAIVMGASHGVLMADATATDAGKTRGWEGASGTDGIAADLVLVQMVQPYYASDVDQRIIKDSPMATPVDQISRFKIKVLVTHLR